MGLYYCEVCDKMMTAGQRGSHDKTVEHEANSAEQKINLLIKILKFYKIYN